MIEEFDNKYLIAYLSNRRKTPDIRVLLRFYRFLNNFFYKTKNYNLYQIKLQWLMEELIKETSSSVEEVESIKNLIHKYNFNKKDFLRLIQSKSVDLENFPFSTEEDFIRYIIKTDVVFWKYFSLVLYGKLSRDEMKSIKYMGLAFGILENIRFSHFKKSRNVYILLYSQGKNKFLDTKEQELYNLKFLLKQSDIYIKKSKKYKKRSIRKILYLNYITENFIKNLKSVNFSLDDNSISSVSRTTYLKVLFSLILIR